MMEFIDITIVYVAYRKSLVGKLSLVLYSELFLTQVVILDKI